MSNRRIGYTDDLRKKQFGYFLVVGDEPIQYKNSPIYWEVQCLKCNQIMERTASQIKKGGRCKPCSNNNRRILENPYEYYFYLDYQNSAKRFNKDFNITLLEFLALCRQNCHYCNQEPAYRKRKVSKGRITYEAYANGIDRKDNDIGYILENCLPCCPICNFAKRSMSYNEFIEYLNKVTNYRKHLPDIGESLK